MKTLFAAVLFAVFTVGAAAQEQAVIDLAGQADPTQTAPAVKPGQPPPPPPQQMLDLSLLEALVSVGASDLGGLFGYMPEQAMAPAFSDYLMHSSSALKRFMKKANRDIKETGGINGWDRQVFMYVMQLNGLPALPPGMRKLSKSVEYDISGFVLARPLSLQQMAAARVGRR